MTNPECIFCGGSPVNFGSGSLVGETSLGSISSSKSDPDTGSDEPREKSQLSTSTDLASLTLDSILDLWEIPDQSRCTFLKTETPNENLTLSLFCCMCLQRNKEILDLCEQISIVTNQIRKVKTTVEYDFRRAYKHNDETRNLSSYSHGVACESACVIGGENEDCRDRILKIGSNLRLLFAQSLFRNEQPIPANLHNEDSPGLHTPVFDFQDFVGDQVEVKEHSCPKNCDSEQIDPTSLPDNVNDDDGESRSNADLLALTYSPPSSVTSSDIECLPKLSEDSKHELSFNSNPKPKSTSLTYETSFGHITKIKYSLPPLVKLKDVSIKVNKLSQAQVVKMSDCESGSENVQQRRNKPIISKKGPKPPVNELELDKDTYTYLNKFPCPFPTCKRSFLTEMERDYHNKKKHERITHPLTCEECGRKFQLLNSYKIHLDTHRGVFSYKCEVCGKGFAKAALLKYHKVKHSTETRFKCKLCPKEYKGHQGLEYHVRKSHTGVAPYTCDVCGKSFVQSHVLSRHVNSVHAKEKTLMCPICGKMFAIQNYFYKHMRLVHQGKPFPSTPRSNRHRHRKNSNVEKQPQRLELNTKQQVFMNKTELKNAEETIEVMLSLSPSLV